jgi:uncharacterized protein (TIGR03067 family)
MRTFAYIAAIAVLAAVLLSGCSEKEAPGDKETQSEKKTPSDIDRLQGTWQMVTSQRRGRPYKTFAKMTVVIEENTLTFMEEGEAKHTGTITLDPSIEPKTLDMTLVVDTEEQTKPPTSQGIYMIEGDTFKWCNAAPGVDDGPTEFSTNEQKNHLLLILKRQKN